MSTTRKAVTTADWCADYQNVVRLATWLVEEEQFTAGQLLGFLARPWDWSDEWQRMHGDSCVECYGAGQCHVYRQVDVDAWEPWGEGSADGPATEPCKACGAAGYLLTCVDCKATMIPKYSTAVTGGWVCETCDLERTASEDSPPKPPTVAERVRAKLLLLFT